MLVNITVLALRSQQTNAWILVAVSGNILLCFLYHFFFSFYALGVWRNGYVALTQRILFLVDRVIKYSVSI